MFSQQERQVAYLMAVIDGMLLVLAFFAALGTRSLVSLPGLPRGITLDPAVHVWLLFLGLPMYWLIAGRYGLYSNAAGRSRGFLVLTLLKTFFLLAVFLGTAIFLFKAKAYSRAVFFLFLLFGFLMLVSAKALLALLERIRTGSRRDLGKVLIVGTGEEAVEIRRKIEEHPSYGMRVIGHLTGPEQESPPPGEGQGVLGSVADLESIIHSEVVDEVVFALPFAQTLACDEQIGRCEEVGITVHVRTDFFRPFFARTYPSSLDGTPMLTVSAIPRDPVALLMKRALDLVASSAALVVAAPLLLLTALLVRISSPGPVLFGQQRIGLNGRLFTMYKFRSMYRDAEKRREGLEGRNEADGPVFKMRRDPRITPVGRWLRRFSLDELPQLWNVLRGDMSLVGPRPPLPKEVRCYERWQRRRLSMRPGLTCLWQVSGRNRIGFEEWMKLDLHYIDNWSLQLDLKILLRTIPAVVLAKGAQ